MNRIQIIFLILFAWVILVGCHTSRPLEMKKEESADSNVKSIAPPSLECASTLPINFFSTEGRVIQVNEDVLFTVETITCGVTQLMMEVGSAPIGFSNTISFTKRFSQIGATTLEVTVRVVDEKEEVVAEKKVSINLTVLGNPIPTLTPTPTPSPSTSPTPTPIPTPSTSPTPSISPSPSPSQSPSPSPVGVAPTCTVTASKSSIMEGESVNVTVTHTNFSQSGVLTHASVNGTNITTGVPTTFTPSSSVQNFVATLKNAQNLTGTCSVPITVNPCGGKLVGGYCWYLSNPDQDCDSVCNHRGGYHSATSSFAGSAGSDTNCQAVLNALQVPGSSVASHAYTPSITTINYGFGCCFAGGNRYRITWPSTTSGANYSQTYRACACRQ